MHPTHEAVLHDDVAALHRQPCPKQQRSFVTGIRLPFLTSDTFSLEGEIFDLILFNKLSHDAVFALFDGQRHVGHM